jgi:hypothetical protein
MLSRLIFRMGSLLIRLLAPTPVARMQGSAAAPAVAWVAAAAPAEPVERLLPGLPGQSH